MRIRAIHRVPFHKSEARLLKDFELAFPEIAKTMTPQDVVVFVSCKGDQLLFVHDYVKVKRSGDKPGEERSVVKSSRHRLLHGTWDPLLLRTYAKEAGLDVRNLKEYENHYRRLLLEQAQATEANHGT
jgi:hypothetical protein